MWKELICLSIFWFLARFCLKAEGRKEGKKFRSLEVREASSLHLKTGQKQFYISCTQKPARVKWFVIPVAQLNAYG
jgi:hypothetical protein